MCLIIYKPDDKGIVTQANMASSINRGNKDGAGIMFVDDGRVKVRKMPWTDVNKKNNHDALIDFCTLLHKQHSRYVMHHRLGTKGSNNYDNTHPFEVLSKDKGHPIDLQMVHNGVINSGECNSNKDVFSDTWHFVNDYLKPILEKNHELIHTKAFQEFIKEFVGISNKLVFLDSCNEVVIINERMGSWSEGVWLSNLSSFNHYTPPSRTYNGSDRSSQVWDNKNKEWVDSSYNKKKTSTPLPSSTTNPLHQQIATQTNPPYHKQSIPVIASVTPKNSTVKNFGRASKGVGDIGDNNMDNFIQELEDEDYFKCNPYELLSTEEILEKLLEDNTFHRCQEFVLYSDSFQVADIIDHLVNEHYNYLLENNISKGLKL